MAANKLKAIGVLEEAKVATLKLTNKAPCIVRERWHRGGNGLWLCRTPEEVREHLIGDRYAVELVPSDYEYRIHVFQGKAIAQQIKRGPETGEKYPIRSHARGWTFAHIRYRDWLENVGVSAVKALGLDFGAVDILLTPQKKCVVLEVNTAPGLEGRTLDVWLNALKRWLGK